MKPRYGMVHGRSQPLQLGQLTYLRTALERCQTLIIGISNPDPVSIGARSCHRG